jgi:hypothetical protein
MMLVINLGPIFEVNTEDYDPDVVNSAVIITYYTYHQEFPPEFTLPETRTSVINIYRSIIGLPAIKDDRFYLLFKQVDLAPLLLVSTENKWREALAVVLYAKKGKYLHDLCPNVDEELLIPLSKRCETVGSMYEHIKRTI